MFDSWAAAADVATALGLPLALLAASLALCSYSAARQAAGDGLMHSLFREFLIARFDYDRSPNPVEADGGLREADGQSLEAQLREADGQSLEAQLAGLKLYALEAMWDWVRRQERSWPLRTPLVRVDPWKTRLDIVASWRSTVLVHLNQERGEVLRSIEEYPDCYSLSFLEFARDESALDEGRVEAAIARRHQARAGRKHEETTIGAGATDVGTVGE